VLVESNTWAEPLNRLDSWVDALKDIVLVIMGVVVSYFTLVQSGSVTITIALLVLTVSAFSTIFLPYKVALMRSTELGVFTRFRALTLMIVVSVSWTIPAVSMALWDTIADILTDQSGGSNPQSLILFAIPCFAALIATVMKSVGIRFLINRGGDEETAT